MMESNRERMIYPDPQIFQTFYDYSRIPVWLLDESFHCRGLFCSEGQKDLFASMIPGIQQQISSLPNPDYEIWAYKNELYCCFSSPAVPPASYICCGPMLLSGQFPMLQTRELSFANDLPQDKLSELIHNLPIVTASSFASYLRFFMQMLNGQSPSLNSISNYPLASETNGTDARLLHELFDNRENVREHTPYKNEVAILSCVRDGDVARLESTYRTLPKTKYGKMSSLPQKQMFYGSIANTTLVTRYAIEGGLNEEEAFTLSDVYIQRMEHCSSLYELDALNEEMALDFTKRVADQKDKRLSYSPVIADCIHYIDSHCHERLTLTNLSKAAHVSEKYLSSLFRRETGQTLSSFIQNKKIDEAKHLLRYSQYSYSEISQYLSFCSQSHFTAVFKKHTGMTPKEYRMFCSCRQQESCKKLP